MTDREIFVKAKELIETLGWAQGSPYLRLHGVCLAEAMHKAEGTLYGMHGDNTYARSPWKKLNASLPKHFRYHIGDWNDEPERTKEEVLSKLDELIAAEPLPEVV